jgi:hypothetical protein
MFPFSLPNGSSGTPAFVCTGAGTEKWPVFDSRIALPDSSPSFTMSYHPDLIPMEGSRPFKKSQGEFIQNFLFVDGTTQRSAIMGISRSALTTRDLDLVKIIGFNNYTILIGTATSMASSCRFDDIENISADGCQGADIFMTEKKDKGGNSGLTLFGVMRNIFVENNHFIFSCFCSYPDREAEKGSFTSRDNPFTGKFGFPAFDSIRFRR